MSELVLGRAVLGLIPNIGPMEWGIILVVALLLFGRRLPEVGRSVGKAIVEFRKGLKDVHAEVDTATREGEASNRSAAGAGAAGGEGGRLPPVMPGDARTVSRSDAATAGPSGA